MDKMRYNVQQMTAKGSLMRSGIAQRGEYKVGAQEKLLKLS